MRTCPNASASGSPARAIQHLETATLHAAELTNQLLTLVTLESRRNKSTVQAVVELSVLIEAGLGRALTETGLFGDIGVFGGFGQIQKAMMHLVRQASANWEKAPVWYDSALLQG